MATITAYIKIEGVQGDATEVNHKDWSEVYHFDFSVSLPQQVGSVAGGGALAFGDVNFSGLAVEKKLEKSSPDLFLACCKGKVFKEVTIERLKKVGSDTLTKAYSIKLTNAVIVNFEPLEETERLTFAFSKVEYAVVSMGADGRAKGTVTHHWDLQTNKGA